VKDTTTILLISISLALVVCIPLLIIIWPNYIYMGYLLVLFVGIAIGPLTAYSYFDTLRYSDMERHFPAFLQELAEAKRAGMNLPNAIINSSKTNYGALTVEVKKMSNQLSWGIPLPKVLKMFQSRTKKSMYINRSMAIIMESYYGGGNIANTLEAISHSISMIKEVEANRESILKEQVVIIYAIHFIFVGIIIAMYKIMLPLLAVQGSPGSSLFSAASEAPSTEYFKILFFLTLAIQSVCNGVVAGEAKEGSIAAGFKHTIVMITVAILGYTTFILPKQITLSTSLRQNEAYVGEEFELYGELEEEGTRIEGSSIIITLVDEEEVTTTDQNGEYRARIRAPDVSGIYTITVTAIYEKTEVTMSKEVLVTD
jgi:archaellum biogenesis protein FlaJ (TadC family)